VFSKKHGVVIPAHAGIQDSCDRGKRHWAPAYAGAKIHWVASVLFFESHPGRVAGQEFLKKPGYGHPRGEPVLAKAGTGIQ